MNDRRASDLFLFSPVVMFSSSEFTEICLHFHDCFDLMRTENICLLWISWGLLCIPPNEGRVPGPSSQSCGRATQAIPVWSALWKGLTGHSLLCLLSDDSRLAVSTGSACQTFNYFRGPSQQTFIGLSIMVVRGTKTHEVVSQGLHPSQGFRCAW